MRKQEMIDIIFDEEKNLWVKFKICRQLKGDDDKLTIALRYQWSAIFRLIQKLMDNIK